MTRTDIPVVLLHGFLGCKDDWHETASLLQSGRRIAVFDLPGHGPAADAREDTDCSMDAAGHRIEAVLEALEAPRAHVIGYSLGARTALHFAVTRPSCVASLVLESGSPGIEDETERAARRSDDEGRAIALQTKGLEAFVDEWEKLPLFETQKSLPAKVLDDQRKRRLQGDAEALARSLRHSGAAAQHWLGERLAGVTVPVLLLAGSLDPKFCAIARSMQEKLPNAILQVVEGAGHNIHLEKAQAFVTIVDGFLARQDADFVQ
jgi:2-succinyl-6-hydroxy-2,4-cyclohexadiene-1-carboxylate synthase